MVLAVLAWVLPRVAEILGMQLAGSVWNALRSSRPWLSQAGEICGGLVGGVLLGLALKGIARARFWPWPLAGLGVGVVYVLYRPAALLAAPAAASLAGLPDRRPQRWVTGLSVGAALAAMAHTLPFPLWASMALCLFAALAVALGYRNS
jgi:hypothetical protein